MEHLIGTYDVMVHVADLHAIEAMTWKIGAIKLYFKEGEEEGDNQGIKIDFTEQKEIKHTFTFDEIGGNIVVSDYQIYAFLACPYCSWSHRRPLL